MVPPRAVTPEGGHLGDHAADGPSGPADSSARTTGGPAAMLGRATDKFHRTVGIDAILCAAAGHASMPSESVPGPGTGTRPAAPDGLTNPE